MHFSKILLLNSSFYNSSSPLLIATVRLRYGSGLGKYISLPTSKILRADFPSKGKSLRNFFESDAYRGPDIRLMKGPAEEQSGLLDGIHICSRYRDEGTFLNGDAR